MEIITKLVGPLAVNCYIVVSRQKNAIVVDPGGNVEELLRYMEVNGLKLSKILLTHGHIDHIGAVKTLKEKTGAEINIHGEDAKMLLSEKENLAEMFGLPYMPQAADILLEDESVIVLDELSFRVIHTPGHTKGSCAFLLDRTVFSGDTLFAGSIGRTDFPGGNYREITQSLRKLLELPEDDVILSGHGEKTTLVWEKENNPYLKMLEA